MARQKLGQHFLSDPGWREQIARAIHVSPHAAEMKPSVGTQGYCWIEVGAGHGEMTQHLIRSDVPVYAVELDPPLVERLKKLAAKHPNLAIVSGDVLQTDLRTLSAGRRIHLYGNLPYYITSPILHHFFSFADLIDEIHIVIQEEVAERLSANPGSKAYGYLSVATQFYTRPEFVFQIPRIAFDPPPQVASALVSMRLPGANANMDLPDGDAFLEFVKTCFAQKRKTLTNNFRSILKPEQTRAVLQSLHIREDARAEQLSIAQLAALFKAISSARKASGPDNLT
ncbi:MAG TPA: 16S rRNA (adenine(1518)-N(6)/adenine(1519)-N(6))-dimethyltransferase RsmA [Candidatus Acidoferrum sp.]|jgi:16S rRNA (adenine1518-N6/adenine1519-N6)-dimethyltransferase